MACLFTILQSLDSWGHWTHWKGYLKPAWELEQNFIENTRDYWSLLGSDSCLKSLRAKHEYGAAYDDPDVSDTDINSEAEEDELSTRRTADLDMVSVAPPNLQRVGRSLKHGSIRDQWLNVLVMTMIQALHFHNRQCVILKFIRICGSGMSNGDRD
ncbi:MAG: hypothetical protein J3Q66DRAFT_404669 [Benniella sp.]|nr:MAG: hypothetical protein J3Q66DRAFT_404669 [Benniella sp.]